MRRMLNISTLVIVGLLAGCAGPQASFKERFHDNFIGTAGRPVAAEETRCITVTKPYTLESGSYSFSIPAGRYVAKKKNDSGYFFYAPSVIKSNHPLLEPSQEGIYLDNSMSQGNLFGRNPEGFDDRPIRGAVLPSAVLSLIQKKSHC